MKNRSKILSVVLLLAIAAAYTLILFALKTTFRAYSWVAYGFTLVGFAAVVFASFSNRHYPMYNGPIMKCAEIYCAVQFVFGGILVMCLNNLNSAFVLVAEVALFAVYMVAAGVLMMFRRGARTQDEYQGKKVGRMRELKIELDAAAAEVSDAELRERISRLAERAGRSDPMSDARLEELEGRIESNARMLREDAQEGELSAVAERLGKLERMLDERNARCAAMK